MYPLPSPPTAGVWSLLADGVSTCFHCPKLSRRGASQGGLPLPSGDSEPVTLSGRRTAAISCLSAGTGGCGRSAASGSAMPVKVSAGEFGNQLALSRDGRRLVYTRYSCDADIWRLELSGPGSPAGPPARLIASTWWDTCPRYSPDGRKIVFVSRRSGFWEIWICDADGSNLIQLTNFRGDNAGTPRWSPDGSRIAFDVLVDGQYDVFAMSVGGGKPRRVTDNPAQDDSPSWSRDGKWIYFASNRTGETQVWKTPAGGGEPIQVTRRGGYAAFESNDGKFLYYAKAPFSGGWTLE